VSAAEWRKAMNAGAGRYAWPGTSAGRPGGRRAAPPVPARPQAVDVESLDQAVIAVVTPRGSGKPVASNGGFGGQESINGN
jgi:hypothetical protein